MSAKKIPSIDWRAKDWQKMVNISHLQGANSPLMQELLSEIIQLVIDNNLKQNIPDLPFHSQSVEGALNSFRKLRLLPSVL